MSETKDKSYLKKYITSIKGIGDTRAKQFGMLGIFTLEDLITHFPRNYEDRSNLKKIIYLPHNESCTFEGTITSKVVESRLRRNFSIYKVNISDETGTITAAWYNQKYLKTVFKPGERYVFYGKIIRKYGKIEVQSPVYEKADLREMKNTCKIIPIYPSTANLSQSTIRAALESVLLEVDGKLMDILPREIKSKYHLCEYNHAISNIHFPKTDEDFEKARYRLVFEELLLFQLGLFSIKNAVVDDKKGIEFHPVDMEPLLSSLPFTLTKAQERVFDEITRDMESTKIMNRLVQGDVGSGKTMVAVLGLYKAVKNGFQGALMVPTEILAKQHYASISDVLEKHGIRVGLLVGGQAKKQRSELLEAVKKGEIEVLIGTHALIEDNLVFERLGLVITDEQHRFGVRQRAKLTRKGENPDVLVMTATPIPRTLALILYGDLDISVIDELPPGRKPIETYAVDNSMRDRINNFIRKKVSEGRQVYIVCPLVEESEMVEAKSALEHAENIASTNFRDLRVGLIHGKMNPKDKEAVMQGFVEKQIDILVSTTVIEVGVNVPNSTVMVIENAERFGLSQLHQLRGRVGRGQHQSYCILYNQSKTDVSRERMSVMQKTNDGFVISEKDLELRGPGEFFGTRQHGIPDLKIANLYRDLDILKKAQKAAEEIMKKDPELKDEENQRLRECIKERFHDRIGELSLN